LATPAATEEEFRADPVVGLAAEVMDPLHGASVPPGPSAAEICALAETPQRRDEPVRVRRLASWQAGYAVRRDWPDGTHELVGFGFLRVRAERFAKQDQAYWRPGPLRPYAYAVVVVSRRDFRLHARRYDCRSLDCPSAATTQARTESPR